MPNFYTYETNDFRHGDYQLLAKREAYFLRTKNGFVVDCAPCIRRWVGKQARQLVEALKKIHGRLDIRRIER